MEKIEYLFITYKTLTFIFVDKSGTSDPYIQIGQEHAGMPFKWHQLAKTSTIKKENNPVWNEKFEFDVDANSKVKILLLFGNFRKIEIR